MRSRTALLATGLGLMLLLLTAPAASASPPRITYTIDGIAGTNGWYRGSTHGENVALHWLVSLDATDTNCLNVVTVPGPTTGTTVTCWASNSDGKTIAEVPIKIDAQPPTGVTASPSRGADFNGWYNHAVAVSWSGTDATSGIAGCSSATYGGPDAAGAAVSGACTDKAGNSASSTFGLNYDGTSPVLSNVSVASGAGLDVVHWSSSSVADTIVVRRSARGSKSEPVVFRGSAGSFADKKIQSAIEYVYSVQAYDQAGNSSQKVSVAGLPKVLTLRKTPYIPRAAQKPILRWAAVRGATYYNVQLFRGSKRILALWPSGHQVGLPTTWKWAGKRYRLGQGRYRWYVWAGIGRRSFANYKTLGSAQFIVPKRG
jgi:hypothetical protein